MSDFVLLTEMLFSLRSSCFKGVGHSPWGLLVICMTLLCRACEMLRGPFAILLSSGLLDGLLLLDFSCTFPSALHFLDLFLTSVVAVFR